MKMRIFGLSAFLCACACTAASNPAASSPAASAITIYYSFDTQPNPAAWKSAQSEVARIFDPASVSINWRLLDAHGGEADSELVVVRFHGACTTDHWQSAGRGLPARGGYSLADSDISNGQILPFADVDCDALRGYLAGERFADPAASLGRAMARVLSHEIYHILTASAAHAHSGIARAEHSRAELTANTFAFGRTETDWLREWSARSRMAAAPPSSVDEAGAAATDAEAGLR
ncbi:MAG TPA: hypothetical protein VG345_05235 [Bryobacteraceae bacterium]|jgi:hypothetical protein|nr:hypothetical protein [Bryobacteraceae bacterium]